MEQDTDPLAVVVPVQVSALLRVNVTGAPEIGPALSVKVPETVTGSLKSLVVDDGEIVSLGAGLTHTTFPLLGVMVRAGWVVEAPPTWVPTAVPVYVKFALPPASVTALPVWPASGPLATAKEISAPCNGSPQLLASVAVTVAAIPTVSVCVGGARASVDPGQETLPIGAHCWDSLPMPQSAPSTPRVFRIWPASCRLDGVPSMETSTTGITPDGVQTPAHEAPFGPTSAASKVPSAAQPELAPLAVCARMRLWLAPSGTFFCQRSQTQVPKCTVTESTWTVMPVLLTMRIAPPS